MKSQKDFKTDGWPESVMQLKERAFDAYRSLKFPTTHDEDWRFTNVTPFLKTPFEAVVRDSRPRDLSFKPLVPDGWQLVFVDGSYSKDLSRVPEDFVVGTIGGASGWEDHFGKLIPFDKNAFVAWNTSHFEDVAFIQIPDGFIPEKPVQIAFINSGIPDSITFPRVLVIVGKDSQLAILETYSTVNGGRSFTNAVTEISLGESAVLQHVKLQQESLRSLHIASSHILQERDSTYTSLSMTLGSELSRENLKVTLNGVGGDCTLNGIYLIENQHSDHHTTIDHAKPHGTSRELYKGILNGKARAVFNGKIIVRKDAQKTDAEQTNKSMLLSPGARVNTTPQLEILADDVKCRHGATIGHLDEDALFYLRTRGLAERFARTLLMKSFLQDVTGRLPEGNVREVLDELVTSRLVKFTGDVL
jgi:Fe-S cluster assembly protein SufD